VEAEMVDEAKGTDEIRIFGRYIVADSQICHGKLTFRGTRIFVTSVLEQVEDGLSWSEISERWGGDVPRAAIAEAVRLANEVLQVTVAESRLDAFVIERRAG
jgi:uncharacterized protein (DUF433 family)